MLWRMRAVSRPAFVSLWLAGRMCGRSAERKLRMSQERFAATYRIPLATLKNWEQGRRVPDAPAQAYLTAIANRPELVSEALAG